MTQSLAPSAAYMPLVKVTSRVLKAFWLVVASGTPVEANLLTFIVAIAKLMRTVASGRSINKASCVKLT